MFDDQLIIMSLLESAVKSFNPSIPCDPLEFTQTEKELSTQSQQFEQSQRLVSDSDN